MCIIYFSASTVDHSTLYGYARVTTTEWAILSRLEKPQCVQPQCVITTGSRKTTVTQSDGCTLIKTKEIAHSPIIVIIVVTLASK